MTHLGVSLFEATPCGLRIALDIASKPTILTQKNHGSWQKDQQARGFPYPLQ